MSQEHEQIYRLPYFVGKARTTSWGIMSKSIGSHILLEKLVLPKWDFPAIYRLEKSASKDRERFIGR